MRTEQHESSTARKHTIQVLEFRLVRKELETVSVYMAGTNRVGSVQEGDDIVLTGNIPKAGQRYVTSSIFNESEGGSVVTSNEGGPNFFTGRQNVFGIAMILIVLLVVFGFAAMRR